MECSQRKAAVQRQSAKENGFVSLTSRFERRHVSTTTPPFGTSAASTKECYNVCGVMHLGLRMDPGHRRVVLRSMSTLFGRTLCSNYLTVNFCFADSLVRLV
uniref:Uncharacterized protein n=1 Tax=Steinernema glaseri TaxID=37863 RepID=A0A1I8AV43_9BILA